MPSVNHVPSRRRWRQAAIEDLPELEPPLRTMTPGPIRATVPPTFRVTALRLGQETKVADGRGVGR